MIGVGLFIHWIWPDLPIGAAFAIAAILCPTDAVAVQAITKGKVLPKGAMTILEGESLLNDAAGIISFKIAVGVLVTGAFHLLMLFSCFNCINWWRSGWFTYRYGISKVPINIDASRI